MLVFLSSKLNALCIEAKLKFVNQNKVKITLKSSHGQNEFSCELAFWFILIENSGKKVKLH